MSQTRTRKKQYCKVIPVEQVIFTPIDRGYLLINNEWGDPT